MTCREKLALEHPECVSDYFTAGCKECPHMYGYLDRPEHCGEIGYHCTECWDREIPEGREESLECCGDLRMMKNIDQETLKKLENGEISLNQAREKCGVPRIEEPRILDSGSRRQFDSGAVRDIQEGKGRCDLLPLDVVALLYAGHENLEYDDCTCAWVFYHISRFKVTGEINHLREALEKSDIFACRETMILEVSIHFEDGARKYGEDNWQKGIPVHCYIDSAVRHYLKFLRGDTDEPHDRAFCWNIMCAIWTCKHKPVLNEYAKKE